ncbi:hypothetical protein CFR76_04425 [Komagataeibacter swingsii]|uniref:Uncharacterized protein n=1 Tax=Komagataeibacter swingsii TaxID=215220 RepID=A0A2V4RNR3_9PROT|nr:hypothetical protein CFR76_04425 [Komagataeibacter swingsii]
MTNTPHLSTATAAPAGTCAPPDQDAPRRQHAGNDGWPASAARSPSPSRLRPRHQIARPGTPVG